jgi:hypothetical protein
VVINTGKTYSGTLKGIDQTSLSIILSDVIAEGETSIPKIFIYGSSIVSFSVAEREVSLEGLAKELEKTFPPGGVQFYPETGIILVMNKIRISKDGLEGSGPLYERVAVIAEDWLKEHGLA